MLSVDGQPVVLGHLTGGLRQRQPAHLNPPVGAESRYGVFLENVLPLE